MKINSLFTTFRYKLNIFDCPSLSNYNAISFIRRSARFVFSGYRVLFKGADTTNRCVHWPSAKLNRRTNEIKFLIDFVYIKLETF